MYAQEDSDLASAGGNLLGTEELGFHDNPDPLEDLLDEALQSSETLKEGETGQTGDTHGEEPDVSHDDEREARYDLMREGSGAAGGQQVDHAQHAERTEKYTFRLRRELLEQKSQPGSGVSMLRDSAAGEPTSRGRWPRWPWETGKGELLQDLRSDSQDSKSSPVVKSRQWKLTSSACDLAGVVIGRLAKLFKVGRFNNSG